MVDLQADGDELEKARCGQIRALFPEYEPFWAKYVVPHREPGSIRLADAAAGSAAHVAQLHYTLVVHLLRVDDLVASALDENGFVEGFARLSSALDVAAEIDERLGNSAAYDPWCERGKRSSLLACENGKKRWLVGTRPVQHYRNRLTHGMALPTLQKSGGVSVPSIDKAGSYLDWRSSFKALASGTASADFAPMRDVLADARARAMLQIQTDWRRLAPAPPRSPSPEHGQAFGLGGPSSPSLVYPSSSFQVPPPPMKSNS